MWLLLLPAAPQVSDEVDPPAENFATVRAHVGLFRGGLHLTRCLNAAPVGGGEAVLLLRGAPRLVCAVGAELGILISGAGQHNLDRHLLIQAVLREWCITSHYQKATRWSVVLPRPHPSPCKSYPRRFCAGPETHIFVRNLPLQVSLRYVL